MKETKELIAELRDVQAEMFAQAESLRKQAGYLRSVIGDLEYTTLSSTRCDCDQCQQRPAESPIETGEHEGKYVCAGCFEKLTSH